MRRLTLREAFERYRIDSPIDEEIDRATWQARRLRTCLVVGQPPTHLAKRHAAAATEGQRRIKIAVRPRGLDLT